MALVWNDTTGGQGLVQEMEAQCALGRGGITSNTNLFQDFTRWANKWNKIGASYVISSFKGVDFDDPNYTTFPSGTFSGQIAADYNFDSVYAFLKVKLIKTSYDGVNYSTAYIYDDSDSFATNQSTIGTPGTSKNPLGADLTNTGFKLSTPFTQAQVNAGANVYVEFFRLPRDFATSGTDAYTTCFDHQFDPLISIGASYEYCKLYKRERAPDLQSDLYGQLGRYGGYKPGILREMQMWYNAKSPTNGRLQATRENNK